MALTPIVRGLYLCEQAVVEPGSRNLTLSNCFRAIRIDDFSAPAPPFFAVALLANGLGNVRVSVRVSRLDDLTPFYAATVSVPFRDRIEEVRFKLEIAACRFPAAGGYEVTLWAGSELLAQTPFQIHALFEDNP